MQYIVTIYYVYVQYICIFVNVLFNGLKTVISDHRNDGFQYKNPNGVSNYINYSFNMCIFSTVGHLFENL